MMYKLDLDGEVKKFPDWRELLRFAQSKGYEGGAGQFFLGGWLSARGMKLYENVNGRAVPVGWKY